MNFLVKASGLLSDFGKDKMGMFLCLFRSREWIGILPISRAYPKEDIWIIECFEYKQRIRSKASAWMIRRVFLCYGKIIIQEGLNWFSSRNIKCTSRGQNALLENEALAALLIFSSVIVIYYSIAFFCHYIWIEYSKVKWFKSFILIKWIIIIKSKGENR